jgi:hypothetical protein
MGYEIVNNITKGYFSLYKRKKANRTFRQELDKYEIDLDDYWIIKQSGNFRFLKKDEYEKYTGITGFKKDLFKKEYIELWLSVIYCRLDLTINYLTKPFPPIEIIDKIKIVKWDI